MPEQLTPLLLQYRRIKDKYRDAILLFRLGDFYEMFYDDAATGARVLGLTLTSRTHGPTNRVPLAGVPAKAVDSYIARLVAAGYRVAVCEQLEVPGLTKLIRRDVVEVITPGTSLRPTLLQERRNQFLVGIVPLVGDKHRGNEPTFFGFAYADVSTGEFGLAELRADVLEEEIQKFDPREVVFPRDWAGAKRLQVHGLTLTGLDELLFSEDNARDKLTKHFKVANLDGFGASEKTAGIRAAGAVLSYLEETQKNALAHIRKIVLHNTADYLLIDRMSRRNLELVERLRDGSSEGTLLSVLDRTKTPAGARLLRRWVLMPLLDRNTISARQGAIGELVRRHLMQHELRKTLAEIGDLERVASRIACERANARDCVALKVWLDQVPRIRETLAQAESHRLRELGRTIEDYSALSARIGATLRDEPPLAVTEGGVIRDGVDRELDELRARVGGAKDWIIKLQEDERKRTGIQNLKVGYNSVFGYYIEVTKSNLSLVPKTYLRKQTVANGERFITPELKEQESRVLNAEERIRAREYELFVSLRSEIAQEVSRLLTLSEVLSELDVLVGLSVVALENNYVCPVVDDSFDLVIRGGRHPVVERLVPETFVPNDTEMGEVEAGQEDSGKGQILLITGPNMAGKSTYLRQVALITIMAQVGSFVPAQEARIGICDKIFTRIGASDDVSRGVSTFLAEMTETANILNNATRRSLVVLDEVGRGTATFDGLAIAWAVVEYLHENPTVRPKTLFATHYHELTDIATYLTRVRNYSFQVKESGDNIVFLRKLAAGRSDRSYGIAVGRLAGLPQEVIDRAKLVLADFEQGERVSVQAVRRLEPLLADAPRKASLPDPREHPVLKELAETDLDALSPLEALNLLADWKNRLSD